MSNKIVLELNPEQVEQLIERLPMEEKIRLVHKLENETWAKKFETVIQKIRRGISRARISDKEIDCLCEEVKKEYDEKHRRH